MKPIGLLLVACSFLGLSAVRLLSIRREIACLRGLLFGLRLIRSEISLRASPLPDLMKLAAVGTDGAAKQFFERVEAGLSRLNERCFADLWRDACRREPAVLSSELRNVFFELGLVLGRAELGEQLAACDRAISKLQNGLDERTRRYPEQRRLSLGLGAAGACFICLLLI